MTLFAVIIQQLLYLIKSLNYSHKDKHEQVWEQTQLSLAMNHLGRRDIWVCEREAYQLCAISTPKESGQSVLQKEHGALI